MDAAHSQTMAQWLSSPVQHQCSSSAAVTQPQQTGASQCYFTGALISIKGISGGAFFPHLLYIENRTQGVEFQDIT